jgi:hypothetical protein
LALFVKQMLATERVWPRSLVLRRRKPIKVVDYWYDSPSDSRAGPGPPSRRLLFLFPDGRFRTRRSLPPWSAKDVLKEVDVDRLVREYDFPMEP